MTVTTEVFAGIAAIEPAAEQRGAHLAAADEKDGTVGIAIHGGGAQASPSVSSIAAAIASFGPLPPHSANWIAG